MCAVWGEGMKIETRFIEGEFEMQVVPEGDSDRALLEALYSSGCVPTIERVDYEGWHKVYVRLPLTRGTR